MKRSILGGAVALLASTTLATAGLATSAASADAPSAGAVSAVPEPPTRTAVTIDAKRVLRMPKTITPGLHAFVVSTGRPDDALFQLVQPDADYTRTEFLADYTRAFSRGSLPALNRLQDNLTWLGGTDAYQGFNGTAKISVSTR